MAVLSRNVSASTGWQAVEHNLETTKLLVQARDQEGNYVPAGVRVNNPLYVEVAFEERFAGQTFEVLISY